MFLSSVVITTTILANINVYSEEMNFSEHIVGNYGY